METRIDEYQAADCFLISSMIETQSIVVLQALAVGLPVLGADALALPELIHPGKNGYLFQPQKEDSFLLVMKKLRELSKSEREKFSHYSLELAQKHNQKKTIAKYLQLYQQLVNS